MDKISFLKSKLIILVLLCTTSFAYAQWNPVGSGSTNGTNSLVKALAVYGGKLYVGGQFTSAGGFFNNYIAQWDGASWSTPVGTGTNGIVTGLCVYAGELYVSGNFSMAGGVAVNNIAKWNGTVWSAVGTGIFTSSGSGCVMCVYGGELYVASDLTVAGGTSVNNIAKWNGSTWSAVGSGTSGPGTVNALTVYNGELIAGGNFSNAGGTAVSNIAKWNGSSWSAVGTGIPSYVYALIEYNLELYAGNQTNGISRWNGTIWQPCGASALSVPGIAQSFTIHNGYLFVGGNFSSVGGNPSFNVGIWDGTNWYQGGTPSVTTGLDGNVIALTEFNFEVYAGGVMTNDMFTGVSCNYIARWMGPTSIQETSIPNVINISPNPSTSQFTFDGLIDENKIEVMDVVGKIVYSEVSQSNSFTIDLGSNDKGLYFYRITDNKNRIQQGKLLLQ